MVLGEGEGERERERQTDRQRDRDRWRGVEGEGGIKKKGKIWFNLVVLWSHNNHMTYPYGNNGRSWTARITGWSKKKK